MWESSQEGVLFDKEKTCLICYPAGKEQASYVVPSEVEMIDMAAFSFAENLTSISMPDSVYNIGAYAFSNCKGLKRLDIPSGVEDIPFGLVQRCTGLSEIVIPASVTSIGRAFFDECENLEAIIPSTDYSIVFSNNQNVGEALVTITFKGNYAGSLKKSFRIVPKGTSIIKIRAKKKAFTVKWKKQAVQTTGYEIQYSTNSKYKKGTAKIVKVKKNKTVSRTISKLKAKRKYYVRIRTYKNVKINGVNTNLYSGWSKTKKVTAKR